MLHYCSLYSVYIQTCTDTHIYIYMYVYMYIYIVQKDIKRIRQIDSVPSTYIHMCVYMYIYIV